MTPNFALSLSFEGITLLRRMGTRWARIEEVPLDHADFDSAVIALRDRAEALDPSGAQVTLIIPNEQIRYLDLSDNGGDEIAREVAIRAALDGATPYAVRELKFDHVVSGGRLHVAAVANETLEEARVFALDHGFTPVSFVAQGPEDTFDGAVFFGKAKGWTRAASRPGRRIEIVPADKAALTPLPSPEPQSPPPAKTPAEQPSATDTAKEKPEASAPAVKDDAPSGPDTLDPPSKPEPPVTASRAAPSPAAPANPPSATDTSGQTKSSPEPSVSFSTIRASRGAAAPGTGAPPLPAATAQLKPRFTPVPQAGPTDAVAPSSMPTFKAAQGPEASRSAPSSTAAPPKTPASPSAPPAPAPARPAPAKAPDASPKQGFFAKSAASDLLKKAAAAVEESERAKAETEPSPPRKLALPKRKPAPSPTPGRPGGKPARSSAGPRAATPPLVGRKAAPAAGKPETASRQPADMNAAQSGKTNPLTKLAALRKAGAPSMPAGLAAASPAMAGPVQASGPMFATANERERMTVFGARDRDAVGGKPRFLGLILTVLLLLFLAGVAAWASVFLGDGVARLFRGGDAPDTAVAAAPEKVDAPLQASDPSAATAPAGDDGAVLESAEPEAQVSPPEPDAADGDEGPEVQLAAFDSEVEAPDAPLAVPVVPRALTPEQAAESYASTGVWQRAPGSPLTPPEDGVDDIYVASIDPEIQMFDAVALPDLQKLGRETVFEDPGLPPPAGLTFDFDERDLVRATPEGALTPDGLRVFTGRPPVIPPLRSGDESRAPTAEEAPRDVIARLDTLPRIRPEARPSDVIEQRERVQLRGISRSELARIRPQMRPQTEQEQAEVEAPEATDLAVERSLVPVGRPRNMAAIVEQAVVEPDPVPVQTAAVAPRTVEPSLPTSASVARSATLNNAINLNKINLIGVYGNAENRRALVRLASGKYQKVKVGDSLDGGRVSAIGDDELRYRKSGRDLVLKMPRG